MRFYAKSALLLLPLCLGAAGAAFAQDNRASLAVTHQVSREGGGLQPKAIKPRPLTPGEGLAILGAALDARHYADYPSDCSHLVHELYGRAGFPYEYASSSDLYAGIDEFRRVASPQPGDLAVWRGHAGIVVNPTQHSFFSVLGSGPGLDSYDSLYWKRWGRPRFFRYVKRVPNGVLSTSIRTASWTPTALGNAEPHEPPAEDPAPDVSAESPGETISSAKVAKEKPVDTETPRVVVNSVRPEPDQVAAAFLQACRDSEGRLRERDLFKS